MWDWYPLTDPDFMLSVLTCNSFDVWNDTGYCDKAYDKLYSDQSAAMQPAQREQVVYQMQKMIASAKPYLVIDYPDAIEAQSSHWSPLLEVGGGGFNSMSILPMDSVHQL
jgi:peptide/nickel transport system substrate-binding protein